MKKLSKEEMKKVMGGVRPSRTACSVWTENLDGSHTDFTVVFDGQCPDVSSVANNYCVNLIVTQGTGVVHCGYDCFC